ncbi:MAG TPA: NADH-quinone oxidoreductase subunit NuoH [Gemmataceae bacterium]|nr:NADH-quinone oxidoreductase subunit NuoH [Gemmataceae bacterium]
MHYEFHPWWAVITIVVVMGAVQGTCAYLILLERKIAAWVQDRIGPNRVGPFGLLQPIADGVKFLLKEDIIPSHVDKLFFLIAPAIAVGTATFAFAVVPFGPTTTPPPVKWAQTTAEAAEVQSPEKVQEVKDYNETYQAVIAPHLDIGFLFLFAVSSLAVYGIILGGWSSNDKYSLMGALRSSAQIISYEIPMGLSILGAVILSGSLNLERIINAQVIDAGGHGWNVVYQPLACLLFLVSIFAECNRLPFDLPEAEQELVGGYHTEYSAMKFALFFLGEYTHMITTSFLFVAVFFGGWQFPWIGEPGSPWVVKLIIFAVKMFLMIVFFMLVRWTIPRFRFDQLMGIAWKVLIPLALANLLVIMVVKQLAEAYGWSNWVVAPLLFGLSLLLIVAAGALALRPTAHPSQRVGMAQEV